MENRSDFEKLVIAKSYINELKKNISQKEHEIGILKSEKEELEYNLDKVQKLSKTDLREIKKDIYVQTLRKNIQGLNEGNVKLKREIKDLKKSNSLLICKIVKNNSMNNKEKAKELMIQGLESLKEAAILALKEKDVLDLALKAIIEGMPHLAEISKEDQEVELTRLLTQFREFDIRKSFENAND
jgi:hypothetical protein